MTPSRRTVGRFLWRLPFDRRAEKRTHARRRRTARAQLEGRGLRLAAVGARGHLRGVDALGLGRVRAGLDPDLEGRTARLRFDTGCPLKIVTPTTGQAREEGKTQTSAPPSESRSFAVTISAARLMPCWRPANAVRHVLPSCTQPSVEFVASPVAFSHPLNAFAPSVAFSACTVWLVDVSKVAHAAAASTRTTRAVACAAAASSTSRLAQRSKSTAVALPRACAAAFASPVCW